MANLRLVNVNITDSTNLVAKFTDILSPLIDVENISITSETPNVPDVEVLKVQVVDNFLNITTRPLTPFASYFISFTSTNAIIFQSLHGTNKLLNDGITNKHLILGPVETDNVVKDFLVNFLRQNVYDKLEDNNSLINKLVNIYSNLLSRSLYDIKQVKNENYLSFNVQDEQKVRGQGSFDRLNEESAYEILRVAKTKTATNSDLVLNINTFNNSLVSLLTATEQYEILGVASENKIGKFNINDFILTVKNYNVSKLKSVIFSYSDGKDNYVYDITSNGYQILDARYDKDYAFSYKLLENNQFKLTPTIISDASFSTENIAQIIVSYEYRNLGRIINNDTVEIFTILRSVREILPPIVNSFSVKHGPITDINGNIPSINGITFTNLSAADPNTLHPAFLVEIPFRLSALPASAGEYSVDYETGTIYVYGEDDNKNGTGASPPLITYNYKYTYKSEIDYVLDNNDIVALPNGNLINNSGKIAFVYEQVLIPDIDYKSSLHKEVLSERINNKLIALNALSTSNSPITNVFRIYNETSGEIYPIVRWFDNKVYFNFINPPNILSLTHERVSFKNELNELLFVNSIYTTDGYYVFECLLSNNNIINATEDGIGSIINSSVKFSNSNIFKEERWFDINKSIINNINNLNLNQYQVNYVDGIVYVAVSDKTNIDIGNISYKTGIIDPINKHLISVDDIYYQNDLSVPKSKTFEYRDFGDGFIEPKTFDISDEALLNNSLSAPYQLFNGKIGAFVDTSFVNTVSNNINFIRGIYEFEDLNNSTAPINFANFASFSNRTITVSSIEGQEFGSVLYDGYYYVNLNLNIPYLSSNITINLSVIRNSDMAELWDANGTIIPGDPLVLQLSGINSPQLNDAITIIYSISINDLSRVIIDYNKGDYYIDYTYLTDEILISYEYGDNCLDFRQSNSLSIGEQYYVSYKVGALRDALAKNFGTLINIEEISNFETDFERERYRDIISAALESFIQGPTIDALKNIGKKISHIQPEVIESIFNNWSLGSSLLMPQSINTTGNFKLVPGKYDNGIMIDQSDQTITLPVVSNLKLEQGSFQSWIIPNWNGIDNNADLTITILKDGYSLSSSLVFIGAGEYHPEYTNGSFTINKSLQVNGAPNCNKDGVFIYYDKDTSNQFDRWYFKVVDGYSDGYLDGYSTNYSIKINTNGTVYDVKSINDPKPNNIKITSSTNSITFTTTGAPIVEGFTFVADKVYYLLDFGESASKNRFSIYKDASGYFNLKIVDRYKNIHSLSADISSWKANELHHIAASWKLNTKNNRDELHLFIDGFETPNIIKYGTKLHPYLHEKFRTINPEEIAGVITKNVVGSNDLATFGGSPLVRSSLNFAQYGVSIGDIIYIDETGFNISGYTILSINANELILSSAMPFTLTDVKFSINKISLPITTEIDIYPNIAVSTISSIFDGYDLITSLGSNIISSSSVNFETENIIPGYLIRIDHVDLETHYTILEVSGNSITINDNLPLTLSGINFHIYENTETEIPGVRALNPSYSISRDGYQPTLTLLNNVAANDLILIKTLGLNHKRIKRTFYQWGNDSNIISTYLEPPISIDQVGVYHVLLSSTIINSNNCSMISNSFTSNNILTDQPSLSSGRILAITVSSLNVDFAVPLTIYVNGVSNGSTITETIVFSKSETINTINRFTTINYIYASGNTLNINKTFFVLSVKEANSLTYLEDGYLGSVIRYSYQVGAGTTLLSDGYSISDLSGFFSTQDINNYILISSPGSIAGTYQITSVSEDHKSATIDTSLPIASDGYYQILNTSTFRSGFQNGFFTFERSDEPGTPYPLVQGLYEFDYYTYLSIKLDPINTNIFIGSDLNGSNQLNSVIDETKITSTLLTDMRIGETSLTDTETITRDFNSIKSLKKDSNTLFLCHYNNFPLTNDTDTYITSKYKGYAQSGSSVNNNFTQSAYIFNEPIILNNDGILNTREAGTIEFWVNPSFDTANDPNLRFYFDASSSIIEEVISTNEISVKVSGNISRVLSVKLKDNDTIDYFAGGRVEIEATGAVVENSFSWTDSSVQASREILQVISVKIENDPTNTDYFANGVLGTDKKTIFLGRSLPSSGLAVIITYKPISGSDKTLNSQIIRLNRALPNAHSSVIVSYIPSGSYGDRISLYKDTSGYLNFNVNASGTEYVVRSPIFWGKNTWHRVKATYSFNSGNNTDAIRLFVDGYEYGNILYGTGILFGDPFVYGSSFLARGGLTGNIVFRDTINELYIGSEYDKTNIACALIDNLRISNIARPIVSVFGESIDVNYNKNLNVVFPVVEDLYTTFLLDFDILKQKTEDFAIIKNRKTGLFDFTINIFDSLDIINNDAKIKQALETLILALKPATSRAFIKYAK